MDLSMSQEKYPVEASYSRAVLWGLGSGQDNASVLGSSQETEAQNFLPLFICVIAHNLFFERTWGNEEQIRKLAKSL